MNFIWQSVKEKFLLPNKAQRGDIMFWSAVFSLLSFTLLFSVGFFFGFKTVKINSSAIALTFALLLTELLRAIAVYYFAAGKKLRFLFCIVIAAVFCSADLFMKIVLSDINVFAIVEAVSRSLLLTALSYKGRLAASVLFSFFSQGISLILPFAPDLPERLAAIISTVLIMMFLIVLDCSFGSKKQPRNLSRGSHIAKCIFSIGGAAVPAAIVLFFAGLMPIHPVSVATGSMQPDICVSDVLLVQSCGADSVNVGDVIQFRHEGNNVMHRVIEVDASNEDLKFITKGDANNSNDAGYVSAEELVGKVIGKIPSLGKLTLWLHSQ